MANEMVQGLLQNLLQPTQGPNPADIMAAISSRNPMASVAAMQAPQLSQMFGQQFRGLVGGLTGRPAPLTANEAYTAAVQQLSAQPDFMNSSASLAQLAKAASAVGRTQEAMQFSLLASQRKQEEELKIKEEQERLLRERQLNAQITSAEAQAKAALANARTPEEIEAAIAASAALTEQRRIENEQAPEKLKIQRQEQQTRLLEAQNRSDAIAAQLEANKLAKEGLDVATRERMNDLEQEAMTQFNQAERLISVANNWTDNPPTPGFFGSLESAFKEWTGTQGGEDEIRRQYNQVLQSGVIASLPPGAASDRDIIEAKKGWPSEFSNPESLARFLRGSAKLAAIASEQAQQKAQWINTTKNLVGFSNEWRKYTQSENFSRDIASKYNLNWDQGTVNITDEEAQELLKPRATTPASNPMGRGGPMPTPTRSLFR